MLYGLLFCGVAAVLGLCLILVGVVFGFAVLLFGLALCVFFCVVLLVGCGWTLLLWFAYELLVDLRGMVFRVVLGFRLGNFC